MDVPGLEIRGLIGTGGNSWVYRAWSPEDSREVAVKVLRGGAEPTTLRRFQREVAALERLTDVPGVVPVLRSGTTDGGDPYLVMPLFARGSLNDLIVTDRPVDPEEAVRLVVSAAHTLQLVHDRGVAHGDIKPANLLLTDDGDVAIADFGISRVTGASQSYSGALMTPMYSAPEAFDDGKPTPQTDVYSLGATLYALLEGHPPFADAEGETRTTTLLHRILEDPVPVPSGEGIPPHVPIVLEAAMAKEPHLRPATASQFAAQLSGEEPPTVTRAPRGDDTTFPAAVGSDRDRRRRLAVVVAVAVLALLASGTALALVGGGDDDLSDSGDDGEADTEVLGEIELAEDGATDGAGADTGTPDGSSPTGAGESSSSGGPDGAGDGPGSGGGATSGGTTSGTNNSTSSDSDDDTSGASTSTTRASTTTSEPDPEVNAPGMPRIGTATAGVQEVTVAFSPPSSNGGAAITSYTAVCTSTNGGAAGSRSGAGSPLVVQGLTASRSYTCTVRATNRAGTGPASASSNAVTVKAALAWISAPSVGDIGSSSAMVFFRASEPTSHTTTYRPVDGSAPAQSVSSPGEYTQHNQSITGLRAGTAYSFTVTVRSSTSGQTLSASGTFTTATATTTTAQQGRPIDVVAYCAALGEGGYYIDVGGDVWSRHRCIVVGQEVVIDFAAACRQQYGSTWIPRAVSDRFIDCFPS